MTTGKQKEDFPGAYIPFDKPVGIVPTVAIDSAPTVQLCVNETWLPYIVTCLKALARPETWGDTYDKAVIAASEFAALVASIKDGCGVDVPSKMCVSGSFLDLDFGFEPSPGAGCVATWTLGVGWEMCVDSTPQGFLQIKREFGSPTIIREVHLKGTSQIPYLINIDVQLYISGTFTSVYSATGVTGPDLTIDVTGLSEPATAMFLTVIEPLGGGAADTKWTEMGLCYTGAFPLSTNDQWERIYDFTIDDQGWSNDGFDGTYSAGVGWVDTTIYVPAEGNTYQGVGIHLVLSSSINVEYFEADFTQVLGSNTVSGEGRYAYIYHTSGAVGNRLAQRIAEAAPPPLVYSGVLVSDTVFGFDTTCSYKSGNVAGDGSAVITRIVLRGRGIPPP